MKRIISLFVIISMLGVLSSCGTDTSKQEQVTNQAISSEKTTSEEKATSEEKITSEKKNEEKDAQKILVIYFSGANIESEGVDAVSTATPVIDNMGSTEQFANDIHDVVGGDLEKIIPVDSYPTEYSELADYAKEETDNDKRPKFKELGINPEEYDTIFIGYPMWWYTLPMIMYTFFDDYDFSGKTIIPFNTHAGSGDGGTYETIKEFEPNATVEEGLALSGERVKDSKNEVEEWLSRIGF